MACAKSLAGVVFLASAALAQDCDRACLTGMMDQYLAAMVAHDASKAPFSPSVKFTENTVKLPLTEGLWFTTTGLTDYKIYVADPQGGAAAFIGVVKEHNAPPNPEKNAILALRLKVFRRQITEAESVVVRNANNLANLTTPRPGIMQTLAANERVSRADLIRATNAYFDGIEQLTGTIVPFHEDCNRLENGMRTAGPPLPGAAQSKQDAAKGKGKGGPGGTQRCADGFNSGVFAVITAVQPRRVLVVDEEKGLTFGVFMFQHRGLATVQGKDGETRPAAYFNGQPVTMPMAELFKMVGGKIREVEAIGVQMPYGAPTGWE